MLTAPGAIGNDVAARLKAYWEANFSGANVGRVAVLGDGLKYEGMTVNAAESQLIEQFQWTAQQICTCFHVPPALLDLGESAKLTTELEALLQKYHSQCIQSLLINFETSLDEGLELRPTLGHRIRHRRSDLDGHGHQGEGRRRQHRGRRAVARRSPAEVLRAGHGSPGGDTPVHAAAELQPARAGRTRRGQALQQTRPAAAPAVVVPPTDDDDDDIDERAFALALTKSLEDLTHAA